MPPCTLGRCTSLLPCRCCTRTTVWCTIPGCWCFTLLVRRLEREGMDAQRGLLSPLRINLPAQPKRRIMAKKPATESTVAQGARESVNPSRSDVKPPQGYRPPFNTLLFLSEPRLLAACFSLNVQKRSEKGMPDSETGITQE